MKSTDHSEFLEFLKKLKTNKFYISEQFSNWSCNKYKISELKATEMYDEVSKKVIYHLNQYIQNCTSKYILPAFYFDEFDNDTLLSSKFSSSIEEIGPISLKLDWRNKFYGLIKRIEWREFELLGNLILKENHISDITITKAQKDQGIDFFGYFKLPNNSSLPRFYNYFEFRVIGQVKHSENEKGVDHQKVASFGTEINKLRKAQDNSYFKNLTEDFIKSDLPIIGIFITNGYYPIKAKDFANEYGIIYWDGEQISQDISTK